MTPCSVSPSWLRTWFCWCAGNASTMRLMLFAAPCVCRVESTRWPVSAAVSAVEIDSGSRSSPMRMTSGSCRSTRRSASAKEVVSAPTSRWWMSERCDVCTNSIGSSTVTT